MACWSAPYSIPPTWTSLILVALLCTTWSYPALARCVWLSQWFPSPPYIIYCYTTFTNNKVTVLLLHIPLEAPWTLQSPDPIISEHLAIITQYAIWAKYLYILQSMAPVKWFPSLFCSIVWGFIIWLRYKYNVFCEITSFVRHYLATF